MARHQILGDNHRAFISPLMLAADWPHSSRSTTRTSRACVEWLMLVLVFLVYTDTPATCIVI
jgi:hypothetical protein